ncbi:TrkA family potassium uptake protein [Dehalococcoidia bacterium]|nr:TrkA family potassium uptake protein [Dehalococcoidia bacterium]
MAKRAAVIGMGRFGVSLAEELYQMGFDVLAIDKDEQVVQNLTGRLSYVVRADSTTEAVLRELGVDHFDLAVVAIGTDIEANTLTTLLLKTLGINEVVARSNNPLHAQMLERIGADKVINPEQEAGQRLAHILYNPDVQEYVSVTSDFGISKFRPPEHVIGKTLEEAGLGGTRDRYGIAVLAIRRGRDPILFPARDEKILQGDLLFVAGKDELLDKVRRGVSPSSRSVTAIKAS